MRDGAAILLIDILLGWGGGGRRWARTLTLNGLFVAAVASCFWGTKRLSVRQKRLNGAPKRPGPHRQTDRLGSHSHLQMD